MTYLPRPSLHHLVRAAIPALIAATQTTAAELPTVSAALETRPHFDDAAGNYTDADDPAIWLNPQNPARSLVAGALKEGGLDLYTLEGTLLQHVPARPAPPCGKKADCDNAPGRLNNVDVVYGHDLRGETSDLIVASDRGLDRLAVFALRENADGQYLLADITAPSVRPIFSANQAEINEGNTAYGLASYRHEGRTLALVSQNNSTRVAVLELETDATGMVGYSLRAELDFPQNFPLAQGQWSPCGDDDSSRPQFEGMVADPDHNALYLAQEDVGVWRIAMDAPEDRGQWQLFARTMEFGVPYERQWDATEEEYTCTLLFDQGPDTGDRHLREDVEGLTIYDAGEGRGYLLVSSQGDNTVAVYDRAGSNAYLGSFRVGNGAVDEVNETDGVAVINAALGEAFPGGLLVMHDGDNQPPVYDAKGEPREGSNFKYVDWSLIAQALELTVETGSRAR